MDAWREEPMSLKLPFLRRSVASRGRRASAVLETYSPVRRSTLPSANLANSSRDTLENNKIPPPMAGG